MLAVLLEVAAQNEEGGVGHLGVVVGVFLLALCATTVVESFKIKFIHESAVLIFIGAAFGTFVHFVFPSSSLADLEFGNEAFFNYVLPPIIFAAGYTLDTQNFIKNVRIIMLLGVVGTLFTFVFLGSMAIQINRWGWIVTANEPADEGGAHLEDTECMLFAAIMSATDSVAVLSLLNQAASPVLYGILSGEGMVNDAVAIVLFRSVQKVAASSDHNIKMSWALIGEYLLQILTISMGSLGMGLLFGLLSALFFRILSQRGRPHVHTEILLCAIFGFASYTVSEMVEMSGIISLFVCGVSMNHYTWYSLSPAARFTTSHTFVTLGFAMECVVFVSLGFFLPHYIEAGADDWSWAFFGCMLSMIFILRMLQVVVLGFFSNLRRTTKYSWERLTIVFYSGVIRGVIAFALSQEVDAKHSNVLIITVYASVIVTTLVGGTLSRPLFSLLGLNMDPHAHEHADEDLAGSDPDSADRGHEHSNVKGILLEPDNVSKLGSGGVSEVTQEESHIPFQEMHRRVTVCEKVAFFFRNADDLWMKRVFGGRTRHLRPHGDIINMDYLSHDGTGRSRSSTGGSDRAHFVNGDGGDVLILDDHWEFKKEAELA